MSRLKSYLFAPAALLCALAMPLSLLAVRTVALPSLPTGELPNSEVVTNIALDVNSERLICLTFSLELDASTSNGVSIAVGAAAGETPPAQRPAKSRSGQMSSLGGFRGHCQSLAATSIHCGIDLRSQSGGRATSR